jgi:hypothetical protein
MGGTMIEAMIEKSSKAIDTKAPLALGDRVRMSELGLARHPKYAGREGVIVGKVSANGLRVKFDERKQVQTIHHSYLMKVDEG